MRCPKCSSSDTIFRSHAVEQGLHNATHIGLHQSKPMFAANPLLGLAVVSGVWAVGAIGRLFNRRWECRSCHHSFTS